MRPAFRILRAVATLGVAAFLVVPVLTASAEDQTVLVGENNENKFTPSIVKIKPGDTVTWQYAGGTDHTVTSTTANWNKDDPVGLPSIGLTTSYLFESPGTYRYICKTHQGAGMKGTVVVEGSTRPSPSRTTRPPSSPPTTRPPTSPAPTGTSSPSPSAGSATPPVPSLSPPNESESPPPLPSVLPPTPNGTAFLGEGGLTAQPASGRDKGLPVMLALLLIGGVGSAELRALLANAPH